MHKPTILTLFETKMSDHNDLTKYLGFCKKIQYPAVRSSGGLVIMWNKDNLNINDIKISPQGIHITVQVSKFPSFWYFSTIYTSNYYQDILELWNQLVEFANSIANYNENGWLVGVISMRFLLSLTKLEETV